MTLIEHMQELRFRVIRCALAVAFGAILIIVFYNQVLEFLLVPYQNLCERKGGDFCGATDEPLNQLDPLEGFSTRLRVGTYGGIIIALPVILWQVWRFIVPALEGREKKYAIPFIGGALVLFVMGAGIAYLTMPKAIQFLAAIAGDENVVVAYSPAKYFQLITYMMLAFGIGFEFPILLIFLQLAGVVTTAKLRQVRRYAIVGIAAIVAVVTPSAYPISMLALTIPMCIFYELAIVFGRVRERRIRRAA